ncbi:glycosyltransferase family 2 protein [Variovorax sp. KK3]|uniref:glycosyltransferase n=1 Tax=Variovorax sp. KK3 TaxID=1855728 RepID=UPI00097C6F63|nr:glycosyltransferase [Variovorax sp. KK3]
MIGIVIPAHNEALLVECCVRAALAAARHAYLSSEPVEIIVVLDACSDDTEAIVSRLPVTSVVVNVRNVGAARAAGAQHLLERGARWLAFTDADSEVSKDWLAEQLRQEADVVCGTVAIDDWSDQDAYAERLELQFRATYCDADGHRHIHGANLGISAQAYRSVGGFAPLVSSEDVALVEALEAAGARIAWSAAPRVHTSARRVARAPGGFAAAICLAIDAMTTPVLAA